MMAGKDTFDLKLTSLRILSTLHCTSLVLSVPKCLLLSDHRLLSLESLPLQLLLEARGDILRWMKSQGAKKPQASQIEM